MEDVVPQSRHLVPIVLVTRPDAEVSGLEIATPGTHLGLTASMTFSLAGGQVPIVSVVAIPDQVDIYFKVRGGVFADRTLRIRSKLILEKSGEGSQTFRQAESELLDEKGERLINISIVRVQADASSQHLVGEVVTVDEAKEILKQAHKAKTEGKDLFDDEQTGPAQETQEAA